MTTKFNELPWHDSTLLMIAIDRSDPGNNDTIKFKVQWPESEIISNVEFHDCYQMESSFNFGIVAPETIAIAMCKTESPELSTIRDLWSKGGVFLDNLKCYEFEMNSTASVMKIFAMSVQIDH